MMEWKQMIYDQLKERNRKERDVYAEIVKHYNRLIDSYSIVLLRCTDQEQKIRSLRQEKNELEKKLAGIGDVPGDVRFTTLQNEYMKAKDEILALLRERADMAKELISLSRIVKERDEKLDAEGNRNQVLTKENVSLKQRLEATEEQHHILQKVNEAIHDEYQALQLAYTQLEKHKKELESDNLALRKALTDKVEVQCKILDDEVETHAQQIAQLTERRLNDAKNDITISSLANLT